MTDLLKNCIGFQWDDGNLTKNWMSHEVEAIECEEIFFNTPLIVAEDIAHSLHEQRFYALGTTNRDRKLFIAFTIRKKLIRIISARDMSKKERAIYEKK